MNTHHGSRDSVLAGRLIFVCGGARMVARILAVVLNLCVCAATTANDAAANPPAVDLAAYEQHALTHAGDAQRGRQLFLADQVTKCVICHKVDGEGGQVGPDLSRIGGKFDRPHLIESLLEPSRQIVEGYRSTVVVTLDGLVATGIVKQRSETAITLADEEGRQHKIASEDIDELHDSSISLMPEGLAGPLTPAQFTDLIAYLETLRSGGKPKFGAGVSGPITLPAGFAVRTVTTGLTGATALETTADGRILICEQTGKLRVVKDGVLLPEPFLSLPVDDTWERGLIGVTVPPDFPHTPYVYVCYVARQPYPHHRVSRFTADGDRAVAGSEKVLLVGDDQRKLGGNVPAGHQGGAIHFGLDGKLYIGIGEQTAGEPSQSLGTFQGKLLRINPDGTIPDDNPLLEQTRGKYQAIWARGLRNPFTFAIEAASGRLLINDVGGKYEEINVGHPGANYGWPTVEHGPTEDARFRGPIHFYPQASISGGDFAEGHLDWPEPFAGHYFFADFVHGWIKTLDPESRSVEEFAAGLRRPVDLRFSRDGSMYVLLRNAWVIDGKFEPQTGSLLQIRHTDGQGAANSASAASSILLSEDAVDESAGNLPAYKVETPTATYYLEKSGAGLSSLLDRDGNDWLSFHPQAKSGAGGEYRGFPNAVHQQAGNYFHARNRATDPATTKVEYVGSDRVTITAASSNGLWACRYDFLPTHCHFTMTRMPADKKYWVLYEGTPGGQYDDDDWWMTSGVRERQPMTQNHEEDIPAPEWMAFGDRRLGRSLFLTHREDDDHPDRFYQMQHKMTVFGFGRQGIDKYLDSVPQQFSIGFIESTKHSAIARRLSQLQLVDSDE